MSHVVNAAGKRGPGHLRAAVKLSLGCLLLSGCSASSDRFSSSSFDSGYETRRTATNAQSQKSSGTNYGSQPRTAQASNTAANTSDGYIQVSRVDLPPLQQNDATQRTRTADGYGRFNAPAVPDGSYTGPRVFTPYDQPKEDAPPPPPPFYGRGGGEGPRYDRGADHAPPPPPPGFYRRSEAPPPEPRGDAHIYEPVPERDFRGPPPPYQGGRPEYHREYERFPERGSYNHAPGVERKVVRIAPGETLYTLARRHGVTVDIIARANGLSTIYVRPGTTIVIPGSSPAAFGQAPTPGPKSQVAGCSGEHCHVVKPGDTLASISKAYGIPERRLAEANSLPDARSLKPGRSISIPVENQAPRRAIASAPQNPDAPIPPQANKAPARAAAAQPTEKSARLGTLQDPQPLAPPPVAQSAALQPPPESHCDAALSNPMPRMGNTFRKPVEGKTIAQFGAQRDGSVNEGITISVPKGTPIKAAENGVVAYVGDELPGFGNLILIRHADEYVTAYAHADAILVKKCDSVKRGQTVATAGATGDAIQPQLHFEIRKNSKPVDPGPLLGS